MTTRILCRAAACLVAGSLTLASLLGAAPALAAPTAASSSIDLSNDVPPVVPTSGAGFESIAASLRKLDGLVSVGANQQSWFVVTMRVDAPTITTEAVAEFALEHSNVLVETGDPLEAFAADEVVGGAGYLFPLFAGPGACSLGFSAWSPTGQPALITAGHCVAEATGSATELSRPATDPAAGGAGYDAMAALGTIGFHQYGGPGDTPGSDGDPTSVDLAVIDVTNPALSLRPAVTDWSTAASDDLAASSIPITSVGEPTPGVPLSKSGRTTGYTTGGTLGIEGWANVGGHWVRGFAAEGLDASGGDSGGAVFQGNRAVGIVSGGVPDAYTWVADVASTLTTVSGGYTLQLDLAAPQVTVASGAEVVRGSTMYGTAPAGSTVTVAGDGGFSATVTAGADGSWSFSAPMTVGDFAFTATATSGFNVSPAFSTTVRLVPEASLDPTVSSPATATPPTGELAATGADETSLIALGATSLALFVVGAGLLRLRRTRYSR